MKTEPFNIDIPEGLPKEQYVYSLEEIIKNLTELQEISGGNECSWRMLKSFVFHPEYPTWLKYIRFARIAKNEYISYISLGDNQTLLTKDMLNPLNVTVGVL